MRSLLVGLALLPLACGDAAAPAATPKAPAGVTVSAAPAAAPTPRVRCDPVEQLAVHYHAHLTVLVEGRPVTVPADIGIRPGCLTWLHTHDKSGIIHIEAPAAAANTTFTLGDFFDVWGQPLDSRHVANVTLGPGQSLLAFADGAAYEGDPRSLPLRSHAEAVLEIAPPAVDPPPAYSFPNGF